MSESKTVEVRGFDVSHGDDGELKVIEVRTTARNRGHGASDQDHEIEFRVRDDGAAELAVIRRRSYGGGNKKREESFLHHDLPAAIAAERALRERLPVVEEVIGIRERVEEFAERTDLEPVDDRRALTEEPLCCGHASWDIDAEPIRENHECEKFYTIERNSRDLECEHRDNPTPPTGDLVPCHETAEWRVVTSRFPGDTSDPDHPGAPTASRYCEEHFAARLADILSQSAGDKLEVRPRDW